VHIRPCADLPRIDIVQVLTRKGSTAEAASLPEVAIP